MKTKLLLISFLLIFPLITYGQEAVPEKTNKKLVSDQYNRSGLTVIAINRGDQFDRIVGQAVKEIPEKFDFNDIKTNSLPVNVNRNDKSSTISLDQVTEAVTKYDLGREVIAFLFGRKADGMMSDDLLQARGLYNATDQDIINARASAAGMDRLASDYDKLIRSSYIMVFDVPKAEKKQTTDKKGKTITSYVAEGTAFLYKIGLDMDSLWATWIQPDDDANVKVEKNKAFNALPITITPIANVSSTGASSDSYDEAITEAYNNTFFKLEKKVDAWQPRVFVASTHPIAAKIGKKEALSNGTRYRSFSYKENSKGNLISVKRGFVRATNVIDNRSVATGQTETSSFYQISGLKNIEPGWLLKEAKDLKIGGGLNTFMHTGIASSLGIGVDIDYLVKIFKRGSAIYAMLDLGIMPGEGFDFDELYGEGALGVGYQIRLGRFFMLMPYADVRAVVETDNTDAYSGFVGAGLKANFQFAYPWQLYIKAGGEALIFDEIGLDGSGITLGFGLRREF